MHYQKYSNDIDTWILKPGVCLQRADNREFIKSWAVYRGINEDFAQSFAEVKMDLEGVGCCFWLEENGKRVAGMVIQPNGIGDFFLIPPEDDAKRALSLVLPLLESWSDEQQSIGAQAITTHYLETFRSFGYVLQESRFWMIRPTEALVADWSPTWELACLAPDKANGIAGLLEEAFAGGTGQYAARDFDAHLASVEKFFAGFDGESDCGRASALVIEKDSGRLAAVCMVDMHKNMPTIRFVAVRPGYQRRGLATNLLKDAIRSLQPNYDWIKLAVTDGNPAVEVYRNLGFIPGDTLHDLSRTVGVDESGNSPE